VPALLYAGGITATPQWAVPEAGQKGFGMLSVGEIREKLNQLEKRIDTLGRHL